MYIEKETFTSKILALILSIAMIIAFVPSVAFAETASGDSTGEITMKGSGTASDPYKIYTKYDLDQVRYDLDACYILMNDIVFTEADFQSGGDFYNEGKLWIPYSTSNVATDNPYFSGIIDGNGHIINGMKIAKGSSFLGSCMKAAIKDLTLRNVRSSGQMFASGFYKSTMSNCIILDSVKTSRGGGMVSTSWQGYFDNCKNYTCITDITNSDISGGIVATADGCTFINCKNYGNINAKYCAGGIVGRTSNGESTTITNCENYGNITVLAGKCGDSGAWAGGIVGFLVGADSSVKNSFNNGTITAKTTSYSLAGKAGGITGENADAIIDCYNSGAVIGSASDEDMVTNVGGISGVCASTIINSFNSGSVKSAYRAGGITGYLKGENARISKSYNAGTVTAVEVVSGVASQVTGGATISNTYYLSDAVNSGKTTSSSVEKKETSSSEITANGATVKKNGTPLSKANMKKKSSYKNFDFSKKWTISSSKSYKYPTLKKTTYKPQVKATGVRVNFYTRTMKVNGTYRLSAIFTPTNTTNKLVTWTSSNPKVVKVDATGKVTALKAGTATITCKSRVGSKTATSKIYVVNNLVKVTKVNIVSSKTTIKKGATKTLKMTVNPSNASEKNFVWRTSNKSVVTVTSTGKIKGIKAGKATITCLAADGSGKKDTCVVTVK